MLKQPLTPVDAPNILVPGIFIFILKLTVLVFNIVKYLPTPFKTVYYYPLTHQPILLKKVVATEGALVVPQISSWCLFIIQ